MQFQENTQFLMQNYSVHGISLRTEWNRLFHMLNIQYLTKQLMQQLFEMLTAQTKPYIKGKLVYQAACKANIIVEQEYVCLCQQNFFSHWDELYFCHCNLRSFSGCVCDGYAGLVDISSPFIDFKVNQRTRGLCLTQTYSGL